MTRRWLSALGLLMAISHDAGAGELQRIDETPGGFPAAVVLNGEPLVHTTQLFGFDTEGKIAADALGPQLEVVVANLKAVLAEAGSGLDKIGRLHVYIANETDAAAVRKHLLDAFPKDARPAATFVVTPLSHPKSLVALDALAVADKALSSDHPTLVRSKKVYGSAGRAHAVVCPRGRTIFVSGQAEPGSLAEATRKTMQSLHDTLKFLKVETADVVQVKSFVQPMSEVATADKEIDAFYTDRLVPPVSHVEWTYPSPIEIEMIAWAPPGSQVKDSMTYSAPPHLKHSPVFSRIATAETGRLILVSGLAGPAGSSIGDDEVRDIFGRLKPILEKAGSDFRHMAKATYYVSSNSPSNALNKIRPELYDPQRPPAASKAGVRTITPLGSGILIDMIATPRLKSSAD